jgi:hypothetical protein
MKRNEGEVTCMTTTEAETSVTLSDREVWERE